VPAHADTFLVGRIECLQCGQQRMGADPGECPRCEYVGWAPVEALDERLRRRLRELPLPERRIASGLRLAARR
jgi:hypothetical protein